MKIDKVCSYTNKQSGGLPGWIFANSSQEMKSTTSAIKVVSRSPAAGKDVEKAIAKFLKKQSGGNLDATVDAQLRVLKDSL
jgi:hypothetical protein